MSSNLNYFKSPKIHWKNNMQNQLITNISTYLAFEDFSLLLTLNKKIYKKLNSSNQFKNRLINFLSKYLKTQIFLESYKEQIHSITGLELNSFAEISKCFSKTTNFIPNPCGNFEFELWNVHNGGDGWEIDSSTYYQNYLTSFVASFDWCRLEYQLQLSEIGCKGGKQILIAGSPVCRRGDCPAKAKIKISILDKNKDLYEKESLLSISAQASNKNDWELLSVYLEIPINPIRAIIKFSGIDQNYWKGNYGPKFGYCYTRLLNIP